MRNAKRSSTLNRIMTAGVAGLVGIGATMLVAVVVLTVAHRQAEAKPEYAQQTGKPCGQCHVNPGGSGKLKPFGQKFKDNGYKIK